MSGADESEGVGFDRTPFIIETALFFSSMLVICGGFIASLYVEKLIAREAEDRRRSALELELQHQNSHHNHNHAHSHRSPPLLNKSRSEATVHSGGGVSPRFIAVAPVAGASASPHPPPIGRLQSEPISPTATATATATATTQHHHMSDLHSATSASGGSTAVHPNVRTPRVAASAADHTVVSFPYYSRSD